MGVGYYYYRPYWRHAIHFATPEVESFEVAVVIIDVVDTNKDRLVWRGWDSARLNQRNFSEEQITTMVEEILSAFPPAG